MATRVLPNVGDRVECLAMPNDPSEARMVGVKGIVLKVVRDVDQVWVSWDNGSALMLIIGVDSWRVIR